MPRIEDDVRDEFFEPQELFSDNDGQQTVGTPLNAGVWARDDAGRK